MRNSKACGKFFQTKRKYFALIIDIPAKALSRNLHYRTKFAILQSISLVDQTKVKQISHIFEVYARQRQIQLNGYGISV